MSQSRTGEIVLTWWQLGAVALGGLVAVGMLLAIDAFPDRPPRQHRRRQATWLALVQAQLGQAGWGSVPATTALVMWSAIVLVAAAATALLVPIAVLIPLSVVAGIVMGKAVLANRIAARQRRLRQAWPGIVDHLRQAVRSGASIADAVILTASHVPDELREIFRACAEHIEQGARLDDALAELKDQLADPVADRIIESLRMAHEVGGRDLPRVLESLQASVRADIGVREDAMAKQSWIRAASRLGVAAPWLVLILLSGRDETLSAYNTPLGSAIIVSGAVVSALAFRMMRRLGQLPSDTRWFAGRLAGAS